ncbi:MAG: nitrogenase [Spirochaetales bacterium]|nr:nitrogenase [Spirochaetales bacterium]
MNKKTPDYVSTSNPCKVCSPLGVSLAVKGLENAMSIMHGSQGCATYIRRYMISHFKEPLDIASSSFDERSAVFGGKRNLRAAIENVSLKYDPELIVVAPTCLSETIGDDLRAYCRNFDSTTSAEVLSVSMPTYTSAHLVGFYGAVRSVVAGKEKGDEKRQAVNIFPSMVSPADLRYLKEIVGSFFDKSMVMPDYSETLDGEIWGEYIPIAPGGTPQKDIASAHKADFSISFSPYTKEDISAACWLEEEYGVEHFDLLPPIGIRGTDELIDVLSQKSGRDVPRNLVRERARLIDALADSHKYTFGKRAVVYGDGDFVAGIASFLDEIGIVPVICACGTPFPRFEEYLKNSLEETEPEYIGADVDFRDLEELMEGKEYDFMIGSSKGYPLSRKRGIPLVRCGFPIHDRIGGPRFLHVGYEGALNLLDTIVNTLLTKKQDDSTVGYSYL